MDSGEKGNFGAEKKGPDPTSYHSSSSSIISSNWRFDEKGDLMPTTTTAAAAAAATATTTSAAVASSSASLGDSFCPVIWGHPQLGLCDNNVPTSSCTANQEMVRKGFPVDFAMGWNWNPLNPMSRGGAFPQAAAGILPQSLAQFPADSAFVERAARLSCFNGGNFSDAVNPFSMPATAAAAASLINPYLKSPQDLPPATASRPFLGNPNSVNNEPNFFTGSRSSSSSRDISLPVEEVMMMDGSPNKNEKEKGSTLPCPPPPPAPAPDEAKQGNGASSNESEEAEFSGGGGGGGQGVNAGGQPSPAKSNSWVAKKRKRTSLTVEVEQDKGGACQSPSEAVKKGDKSKDVEVDQSPVSGPAKAAGKQGKDTSQASDGPKDEYIHVRARRGQATNSHSLAERVRREKISERMKFLQDLVPGCSKVTGKAVMLDEIINYVQSLQRQVEFLSMKLATVNPTLDFNIEGLLAKEILHSRGGQSSLGFSPDLAMAHNQLHPSQQSLIHAGISGLGTTSEALRTNSQLTPMTGAFKELPLQLHNAWDDELHNVVQMNFGATASFNSQDLNGSLPPGRMKVEL
ncbi:hypothetical protein Sjap_015348 [Stephania japonica]|uniref:BHLH domain-containing protein n=1 Tax=Stephania japonica TaxID=461633 RepID=A0AAP0IKI5_9MAGN